MHRPSHRALHEICSAMARPRPVHATHAASQQPATRPCRDPQVLPVFLFDPRQYRRTARGCDKTGPFRAKFLYESVLDLRQQLRGIGSDLLVGVGKPEELLPRLVRDRAEIEPRSRQDRDLAHQLLVPHLRTSHLRTPRACGLIGRSSTGRSSRRGRHADDDPLPGASHVRGASGGPRAPLGAAGGELPVQARVGRLAV